MFFWALIHCSLIEHLVIEAFEFFRCSNFYLTAYQASFYFLSFIDRCENGYGEFGMLKLYNKYKSFMCDKFIDKSKKGNLCFPNIKWQTNIRKETTHLKIKSQIEKSKWCVIYWLDGFFYFLINSYIFIQSKNDKLFKILIWYLNLR